LLEKRSDESEYRLCIAVAAGQHSIPAARLKRAFERVMRITPRAYAEQLRIMRLKKDLIKEGNVANSLYKAGFGSSSRLYERSNQRLGMTPATYGRGGRGMQIRYTITPTAMGPVLVAATERGVCAVNLGRPAKDLITSLCREYPEAQIAKDDTGVSAWVSQIVQHIAGENPSLDVPLDIYGTAFQRRVWDELRRIPYGQTRSYTEIARQLGHPQARRAVARACATNPVALVIPCHRVIRSDGKLGGYGGGGIKNKQTLLDQEKRTAGKL
jgi:AraC family transcriptional regulator of adaptative response/methylated-DNA-[protein]-cysteine methyltransferase